MPNIKPQSSRRPSGIAALLFLALSLTGCLTVSYHDRYVGRMGSASREFLGLDGKYRVFEGRYEGPVVLEGRTYTHLQVAGALRGNGRLLDIYLPAAESDPPLVRESARALKAGKPCYFFLVRSCCPDEHREILEQRPRARIADPDALIEKYFGKRPAEGDHPVLFCQLPLTNVDRFSLTWIAWNRDPDGSAVVDWHFRPDLPYPVMDLEWRERSRALFVLSKAGYVLPVLGDIATLPFQLIGVIIYFAAGGAAR